MHVEAWSQTPDADMSRLYAAEARRWREALHWDYAETRHQLERVRTQRLVPGFVVRDRAGDLAGWTYYARVGDELQIGALTAATPDAASTLVGCVLASPEASRASRTLFFGFADAPDAEAALRSAGCLVGAYRYLVRMLSAADAAGAPADAQRPWREGDLLGAAALLRDAYPDPDPLRPFGGAGTPAEWLTYTHRLIATGGCGVFVPALSIVQPGPAILDGLTLVTRVAPDTVHLAQVAVRAASRGRGLGAAMIHGSLAAAARAGFARMTLLVSDANTPARRLYARLGFEAQATFVSASRSAGVCAD